VCRKSTSIGVRPDQHSHPAQFAVGDLKSASGENMGSSKILSLGRLASLSEQETLCLFGQYYKVYLDII